MKKSTTYLVIFLILSSCGSKKDESAPASNLSKEAVEALEAEATATESLTEEIEQSAKELENALQELEN